MVAKELAGLGGLAGAAPRSLVDWGSAFGRRTLVARRRVGDRRLEAARDGVAPAVDRLDVALPDLLLEQGIGHGDRCFRAGCHQPHQQEVRDQDQQEPQPHLARRHLRGRGALRGSRSGGGWRGIALGSCLLSRRAHDCLLLTTGRATSERFIARRRSCALFMAHTLLHPSRLRASVAPAPQDFAIAMVDELERPTHRRRRFTVGY